jgi:hypothetical protein
MRELIFVAPYLGIRLTAGGILSDAEADAINTRIDHEDPFGTEFLVWIVLFESCRIRSPLENSDGVCSTKKSSQGRRIC